jgi:hypothetical protein
MMQRLSYVSSLAPFESTKQQNACTYNDTFTMIVRVSADK